MAVCLMGGTFHKQLRRTHSDGIYVVRPPDVHADGMRSEAVGVHLYLLPDNLRRYKQLAVDVIGYGSKLVEVRHVA